MPPLSERSLKSCLVVSDGREENKGCGRAKKASSIQWDHDNNTVFYIACLDEMEQSEIESYWYSKSEFGLIKLQIQTLAERMARHKRDDDEHCYRGLEYKSKIIGKRRKIRKRQAWSAVFEEQKRQQNEGEIDEEVLAEVYKGYSRMCCNEAFRAGVRDEEIASSILEDVAKDWRGACYRLSFPRLESSDHPERYKDDTISEFSDEETIGSEPIDSDMKNANAVKSKIAGWDTAKGRRSSV